MFEELLATTTVSLTLRFYLLHFSITELFLLHLQGPLFHWPHLLCFKYAHLWQDEPLIK